MTINDPLLVFVIILLTTSVGWFMGYLSGASNARKAERERWIRSTEYALRELDASAGNGVLVRGHIQNACAILEDSILEEE